MRDRLPGITALALLTILVAGTWWAAHYTQSTIELDPPSRSTHEPDSWAEHFVMLRTNEQGVAINRLEGDFMQHYPDDDSYHVDKITVKIQQNENPLTTGTSDTAIMDQGGAQIQMTGNALIKRQPDENGNIFSINSAQLTLLPHEDRIHTKHPATVMNGNQTLQGKGMYYDNSTRQLRVLQNTEVTMPPTSTSTTASAP